MASGIDLTGVWTCDDGGIYYLRQLGDGSVAWAGLQDSGFHKGLGFTNVFHGRLFNDEVVVGEWADVPRGEAASSGILNLSVVQENDGTMRLLQVPAGSSGDFSGEVWTSGGKPLEPQNIVDLTDRVWRYDVPLGHNNPPGRDFTVMWGQVWEPKATLPPDLDDYCTFRNMVLTPLGPVPGGGWGGDGDFTFNISPLWEAIYPNGTDDGDFWTHGWVKGQPDGWPAAPVETIAQLYQSHNLDSGGTYFHCETPMYGRENGEFECAAAPMNVLPGWNEIGGWSVLVNGRPIEGRFTLGNPNDFDTRYLSFDLGDEVVEICSGGVNIARVTGVVAYDVGHPDPAPEIHPVYAIDVLQEFASTRLQPITLSGAWHGSDNGTYYLRQLGSTIWWLGLSRDQGRSFANVFHGRFDNRSGTVTGQWVDVPMGGGGVLSGGTLALEADTHPDAQRSTALTRTSESAPFGSWRWSKLYDTAGTPAGSRFPAGRHSTEPPVAGSTY